MAEVQSFLKLLSEVYGVFGLDYSMALSTRPGEALPVIPLLPSSGTDESGVIRTLGFHST